MFSILLSTLKWICIAVGVLVFWLFFEPDNSLHWESLLLGGVFVYFILRNDKQELSEWYEKRLEELRSEKTNTIEDLRISYSEINHIKWELERELESLKVDYKTQTNELELVREELNDVKFELKHSRLN